MSYAKVDAIESTIRSYENMGANPCNKKLTVSVSNFQEAIELYLSFKNRIDLDFIIDGTKHDFFSDGSVHYAVNMDAMDYDRSSGMPYHTALAKHRVTLNDLSFFKDALAEAHNTMKLVEEPKLYERFYGMTYGKNRSPEKNQVERNPCGEVKVDFEAMSSEDVSRVFRESSQALENIKKLNAVADEIRSSQDAESAWDYFENTVNKGR